MKKNCASPRGVLVFDMDGTLIDTSGDIVHSINYIRDLVALRPLSEAEVLGFIGHGSPYLLSRVTGIDEGEPRLEEIQMKFKDFYLTHQTERSHPYPGMRQALQELQGRYDLYVLSNKPHVAVLAELKGHEFTSFFRGIWGAGALPEMKPDPIGILTAAQASGMTLSKTVMIGDMLPDIQAAQNAGSKSCFVSWGFGEFSDGFPTPSAIVDAVSELSPALDLLVTDDQKCGEK